MYTIAVEIHGLRQLTRLQPELLADVRRRVISIIEVQGGSFALQHGSAWLFRFARAQPDDRQGVLDALTQTVALLQGRENDLSGWNLAIDFLETDDAAAADRLHELLLPVATDNTVWIAENAYALLAEQLDTDEISSRASLRLVTGRRGAAAGEVGSAVDLARSDRSIDSILESLVPDELVGGMLLVVSEDALSSRINARAALGELVGSNPAIRWLEAEADAGPYGPLVSAFTALDVHETRFWLREAELGSWSERVALVEAAMNAGSGVLPDALDTDLLMAFEIYLTSYVRRAAASVIPPILLCHNIDRWSQQSLDGLARTVERTPVVEGEPAIIIVGTASRAPAGQIERLIRRTIRLSRPTTTSLRESAQMRGGAPVNWERAMRVTHGGAGAIVHYLANAHHWDGLTDVALDRVSVDDLAWRVVAAEDSEIQELLLAAHYTFRYLTREQYIDVAVSLGTDRVRVPAALSRLRLLGLIDDRDRVVPTHPELRVRLEDELGRAAQTLFEKASAALAVLVERGELELDVDLLQILSAGNNMQRVPTLFHRLLSRTMGERRLEDAHRLLYDSVPLRGFSNGERACFQQVVVANRLRLALLEGNVQAAERTRAQDDRSGDDAACQVAAGDLAIQKARVTFHDAPSKETIALLKRAILVYQESDDQAGLARANLDFGLVVMAQEDLLGAREYFLIAEQSAANGGDLFEQIRARILMLVCTFVQGNLSRASVLADDLDARAGDSGMREVQLFAELTRGRILFELGRYEDAADSFARGRSRARLYGMTLPGIVLERWLARSLVYDGRVRRGTTILQDHTDNAESLFFLAEALLRTGEHADAIASIERGLAVALPPMATMEAIGWATGYASLEDRAIGVVAGSRVLQHQMMALRGYLLAESGRQADGVQEMYRLTRELRISEIDPYNRIYFYLYSLILPESGELNVEDGTTVLGKAVRYIQQRTSKMDEYAHKTDYLRRNYWNVRLMGHAQVHNLV